MGIGMSDRLVGFKYIITFKHLMWTHIKTYIDFILLIILEYVVYLICSQSKLSKNNINI